MKYTNNLSSTQNKTVEQIEVMEEEVLLEVPKLDDLVMNKNKEINVVFSRKKTTVKKN